MDRRKLPLILALAALALMVSAAAVFAGASETTPAKALTGPPISSPHFQLDWNVSAPGGGTVSSPHYQVSATVGQPATGFSGSNNFEVCSGFWCKVLAFFEINLPIINRNLNP